MENLLKDVHSSCTSKMWVKRKQVAQRLQIGKPNQEPNLTDKTTRRSKLKFKISEWSTGILEILKIKLSFHVIIMLRKWWRTITNWAKLA